MESFTATAASEAMAARLASAAMVAMPASEAIAGTVVITATAASEAMAAMPGSEVMAEPAVQLAAPVAMAALAVRVAMAAPAALAALVATAALVARSAMAALAVPAELAASAAMAASAADPLSDPVSGQYSRWVYPQPIVDLPQWLQNYWQWFDPRHAHRLFWPDRDYRAGMDILVAGCGTNQAAVLAFTNPQASVVAIDVSGPSLEHHRFLKEKYALANLELHLLPIEEAARLERDFDLIVTTGVLHHLASPQEGMNALAGLLRSDGVLAVMLYAKFGRLGVEMLQEAFRVMGLRQDEPSLALVKEAVRELPQDHPVLSYIPIAPDLEFDAGLVDTFLHEREQSYTIDGCRGLVSAAGLVFQDLFFKAPYHPPALTGSAFHTAVARLPAEKQWSIMERVNFSNACHFFMACRPERKPQSYRIDFRSDDLLSCVPAFRYRCALNGEEFARHNWSTRLTQEQLAVIGRIDGQASVAEIIEAIRREDRRFAASDGGIEAETRAILEMFWKLDFLEFSIPALQAKP